MRVAKDSQGNLVYCESGKLLDEKQIYYCPTCGERVDLHKNKKQVQFFVHRAKKHTTGETKQHRQGKTNLEQWLRKSGYLTTVEMIMENKEQRADVICEDVNQTIVIEYQCSAISFEELLKRDKGYHRLGYPTLWIFGEAYYQQQTINDVSNYCMNYHYALGNFLIFLVDDKIIIKSHLRLDKYTRKYIAKDLILPLKKYSAKKLLSFFLSSKKRNKQENYYLAEYFTKEKKQRILLNTQEENRQFLLELYLAQIHLFDLPKSCWQLPKYSLVFKSPNYIWRGYLILWLERNKGKIISLSEALTEVYRLRNAKKIRIYPSQHSESLKYEIYLFLTSLAEQQKIDTINKNEWMIRIHFEIKSKKW